MTREEAMHKWVIPAIERRWNDKKCKEIIKALEQEPCDDAISRERTMLRVREFMENPTYTEKMLVDDLNALPSVNPQPKTGHWIKDDITERSKSAYKHKCDRCGAYHRAMYDYCPSCGAKNVEPQERSGEE